MKTEGKTIRDEPSVPRRMSGRKKLIRDLIAQLKELEMDEIMRDNICILQEFIETNFKNYAREDVNWIIHDIVDTANNLIAILNLFEKFAIEQQEYYDRCDNAPGDVCVQGIPEYEVDTWKFCAKQFFQQLWEYKRFFKKKLSNNDDYYEQTEHLKITDAQIDRLFPC